jgi:hypothetical protein
VAGTLTVDTIQSDSSYASTLNVASKMNFTSGMQIGGQDTTFGGMRNRIINGDMRINQRGNTTYTISGYNLDRWESVDAHANAAFTVGASADFPAGSGSSNSAIVTITSSGTTGSGDIVIFRQSIEGFNVEDLEFGTATAKTVSLSFWVKSSVTGTYSVAVSNSANNRHYIRHYTIISANTWEYKTVTIPGDTTGTWLKGNSAGLRLKFALAAGTTYQGTVDSWNAADVIGTSSAVNLTSTNGATWQITGVQLEKGSAASAFENRQYGTELALCQRYFQRNVFDNDSYPFSAGYAYATNTVAAYLPLAVSMRATPTAAIVVNMSIRGSGLNNQNLSSLGTIYQGLQTGSSVLFCNPTTSGTNLTASNTYVLCNQGGQSGFTLSAEL